MVGTVAYMPPEQALGPQLATRAPTSTRSARCSTSWSPASRRSPATTRSRSSASTSTRRRSRPRGTGPRSRRRSKRSSSTLLAKAPDDRPAERRRGSRAALEAAAAAPAPTRADGEAANPLEASPAASSSAATPSSTSCAALLDDALAGAGRLLLLAGEPGIGKTRTAEQLATYARVRGARVLWGRCHETRGRAAVLAVVGGDALVRPRGRPGRAALAARQPRRRHRADRARAARAPRRRRRAAGRWRPSRRASGSSTRSPASSRRLERAAAGARARRPALGRRAVAAAAALPRPPARRHRPAGRRHLPRRRARPPPPARRRRSPSSPGSTAPAASSCAASTPTGDRRATSSSPPASIGRRPSSPQAIREQTEGNPFFIGEVVRLMAAEGRLGEDDAPRPRSRSRRASARSSAGGSTGSPRRPTRCCGSPPSAGASSRSTCSTRVCERSTRTRSRRRSREAVERTAGRASRRASPARYSFSHALVRETLHAEVPARERAAHAPRDRRGARARSTPATLDRHLGELAHHFLEAAPLGRRRSGGRLRDPRRGRGRPSGSPTRTPPASTRRRSRRSSSAPAPTASAGSSCCSSSATAQTPRRARSASARTTLERAAELARELGRPEELARAALGDLPAGGGGRRRRAADRAARGGARARSATATRRCARSCSADSPRSSTGSTRPGARTSSGSRRWRWRAASATPTRSRWPSIRRQFTGGVGPERDRSGGCARASEMHELAKRARRPRARAARARLPAARPARARRHRAASTPSSPPTSGWPASCASRSISGTCPLLRGDAGADRRPLRRRRGARRRGARRRRARAGAGRGAVLRDPDRAAAPPAPLARGRAELEESLAGARPSSPSGIRRSRPGAARWPRPTPSSATTDEARAVFEPLAARRTSTTCRSTPSG